MHYKYSPDHKSIETIKSNPDGCLPLELIILKKPIIAKGMAMAFTLKGEGLSILAKSVITIPIVHHARVVRCQATLNLLRQLIVVSLKVESGKLLFSNGVIVLLSPRIE